MSEAPQWSRRRFPGAASATAVVIAGGSTLAAGIPPRTTGPPVDHRFHPLAPVRILDSRPATSVGAFSTPWAAGTARDVVVAGAAGVPAGAGAVVLNVMATGTRSASFLKVWPTGAPKPATSSLNWVPDQTVANSVTATVGAGCSVTVANSSGTVDVVVDVVGYYDDGPGGAGYTPHSPERLVDSRPGTTVGGFSTPWSAGTARDVAVAGVPAGADAVVLNVTATATTAASHLTVWPAGAPKPVASSLNWAAGRTVANAVTTPLGSGGAVAVTSPAGGADVIVDVIGWYG